MRILGISLFALLSTSASAATPSLEDAGAVVTLSPGFAPMALVADDASEATDLSFLGQIYTSARGWTTATFHVDMVAEQLSVSQGARSLGNFEIQDLMSFFSGVVLEDSDFAGIDTAVKAVRIPGAVEALDATFNWKTLRCELELDDFDECNDRCEDQGYPGSLTDTAWVDGGCVLLCTCYDGDGNKGGVFIEEDDVVAP